MQVFTYGHLKITPALVATRITLDELQRGMQARAYAGHPPSRGWSALRWRSEQSEAPKLNRANPGSPSIEAIKGQRVLLGRLLIDRENSTLLRRMGPQFEQMPAGARYIEDAVDVLILGTEEGLQTFVSTHDEDDVTTVLFEIRRAADSVGGDDIEWSVTRTVPELTPESDLFLWMLYHWERHDGKLCNDLELIAYNTWSARNSTGGVTRSLRGIDLNRIDTLGAVTENQNLGPAKFALHDRAVGLVADLFLLLDGSFDLYRQGTEYDGPPLDRAQLGLNATIDVSTIVLPKLRRAWMADSDWRTTQRQTFRDECRAAILARYS